MKGNLFFIIETITNGYTYYLLEILSIFSIICAIFVIISKNPIVSILFLIGLFGGMSCYLIATGISFIGLSYLIVYIGAVSILFLFILMLINIRMSEVYDNNWFNSLLLAIITTVLFYILFYNIMPYKIATHSDKLYKYLELKYYYKLGLSRNIYYITGESWDRNLVEISDISNLGNVLYTNYNIWLLISSFILLLAMVGVIVIIIKKK